MRSEHGRTEARDRFQFRGRFQRGSARLLAVTMLSAAGLCAAATTATWAQSAKGTADKAAGKMAAPRAGADNTLTAKEKADGRKLLFDGKTTDGWRVYKKQGAPVG
jgi:hypothetical protein